MLIDSIIKGKTSFSLLADDESVGASLAGDNDDEDEDDFRRPAGDRARPTSPSISKSRSPPPPTSSAIELTHGAQTSNGYDKPLIAPTPRHSYPPPISLENTLSRGPSPEAPGATSPTRPNASKRISYGAMRSATSSPYLPPRLSPPPTGPAPVRAPTPESIAGNEARRDAPMREAGVNGSRGGGR